MKLSTIAIVTSLIAPSAILWSVVAYHSATRAPNTLYKGAFEQVSNYEPSVPKAKPATVREAPATIRIAASRKSPSRKNPPDARRASECYLHLLAQGGSPAHPFVLICP